jgi:hypothetical protein
MLSTLAISPWFYKAKSPSIASGGRDKPAQWDRPRA